MTSASEITGEERRVFAVIGATGNVGRHVVASLFELASLSDNDDENTHEKAGVTKPITIRVISRNSYGAKNRFRDYPELTISDDFPSVIPPWIAVEFITADFNKPETIIEAFKGAESVFFITVIHKDEVKIGKSIIDAAISAKVPRIVYSSVCNSDQNTRIPHFDSKHEIEKYLQNQEDCHFDFGVAIIRPAFFFENFETEHAPISNGSLSMPIRSKTKLKMISCVDIGVLCAAAMLFPDEPAFAHPLDAATEELNPKEMVSIITRVSGTDIDYCSMNTIRRSAMSLIVPDMARMFDWFDQTGYTADIQDVRSLITRILSSKTRHSSLSSSGFATPKKKAMLSEKYLSFEEYVSQKSQSTFLKDRIEFKAPATSTLVAGAVAAAAVGIGAILIGRRK